MITWDNVYWSVMPCLDDTVSATFGMGKLKAFNKFKESCYWRSAITTVCGDDIKIHRVVELGEKFYINLYGKVAAKAKSLDQVRETIYNLPRYIPVTRILPTSRVFYFHMCTFRSTRGNICGNFWNLINLVFQGWKRQRHSDNYWQHRNTCFRKWSAVARNQLGQVYCVQVVRARNLGCQVLNFANVVVNVTIAVKYAVLPPNALFTFVLRLRKSWWVLLLFS